MDPPVARGHAGGRDVLVASSRARDNVVWHAALGGLLGLFTLLVLSMVLAWDTGMALLAAATDAKAGTSKVILSVGGVLVLIATILPVSLMGASVGEHLAVHRRRRPATSTPVDAAPVKLSDAELAKVDL